MNRYAFRFKVQISEHRLIEGTYTVLAGDYITGELELREYLKYGLGNVPIEVELDAESEKKVMRMEAGV